MSPAFLRAVEQKLPNAAITVDWFHIVQLFTRSVAWPGTRMVWLPGQRSNTSAECRRRRTRLRRRSVIEPLIGPMKVDGLTDRNCLLKGAAGDAMRAILCAASEPA